MLAASLAICSLVLAPVAVADPRPSAYVLPGPAVFPEGVAFQPSTGSFFVSSPTDGAIFKGHVSEATASIFLPVGQGGRTAAIGLEIDGDLLYVVAGATGRIFVYDAETAQTLASFQTGSG